MMLAVLLALPIVLPLVCIPVAVIRRKRYISERANRFTVIE